MECWDGQAPVPRHLPAFLQANQECCYARRAASVQGRQVCVRRDTLLPAMKRLHRQGECRYCSLDMQEIRGPLVFGCRQTLQSAAYARSWSLRESHRNRCTKGALLGSPRADVVLILLRP